MNTSYYYHNGTTEFDKFDTNYSKRYIKMLKDKSKSINNEFATYIINLNKLDNMLYIFNDPNITKKDFNENWIQFGIVYADCCMFHNLLYFNNIINIHHEGNIDVVSTSIYYRNIVFNKQEINIKTATNGIFRSIYELKYNFIVLGTDIIKTLLLHNKYYSYYLELLYGAIFSTSSFISYILYVSDNLKLNLKLGKSVKVKIKCDGFTDSLLYNLCNSLVKEGTINYNEYNGNLHEFIYFYNYSHMLFNFNMKRVSDYDEKIKEYHNDIINYFSMSIVLKSKVISYIYNKLINVNPNEFNDISYIFDEFDKYKLIEVITSVLLFINLINEKYSFDVFFNSYKKLSKRFRGILQTSYNITTQNTKFSTFYNDTLYNSLMCFGMINSHLLILNDKEYNDNDLNHHNYLNMNRSIYSVKENEIIDENIKIVTDIKENYDVNPIELGEQFCKSLYIYIENSNNNTKNRIKNKYDKYLSQLKEKEDEKNKREIERLINIANKLENLAKSTSILDPMNSTYSAYDELGYNINYIDTDTIHKKISKNKKNKLIKKIELLESEIINSYKEYEYNDHNNTNNYDIDYNIDYNIIKQKLPNDVVDFYNKLISKNTKISIIEAICNFKLLNFIIYERINGSHIILTLIKNNFTNILVYVAENNLKLYAINQTKNIIDKFYYN